MSTRGLFGIRYNGIDKATYNHWDSYPEGLGNDVLEFCSYYTKADLIEFFNNIILTNHSDKSYKCDFEKYKILMSDGYPIYMLDNIDFIKDSLFCEYAYIINLDTEVLEFYEGFQRCPDKTNRYGTEMTHGYYPCKKVLCIPLEQIRGCNINSIIEQMINCSSSEDE